MSWHLNNVRLISWHPKSVEGLGVLSISMISIIQRAKKTGGKVVREPWEESDEHGTVRFATIQTYGDTTHTFIDKSNYNGWFLPNFGKPLVQDCLLDTLLVLRPHSCLLKSYIFSTLLYCKEASVIIHNVPVFFRPVVGLQRIDHCVGNQPDEEMVPVAQWFVCNDIDVVVMVPMWCTATEPHKLPFKYISHSQDM